MARDLKETNVKAFNLLRDTSPYSAGLCPRRAGKSYTAALLALITGLAKPDSIVIIISLNLKQLRRLYWDRGPSGLFAIARRYKIDLEVNNSMLRWTLPNGSVGYLMGSDDEEQMETIRGLEADLYVIDECKSFVPETLRVLIDEIIAPQRATRKGRVVLIGTPGHAKAGPFYQATCPRAIGPDDKPTSIEFGQKDPWGRSTKVDKFDPNLPPEQQVRLWSRHHWTLQDNTAVPHQWEEAQLQKAQNGWGDDHPIWRREYLGEWTDGGDGLVYKYTEAREQGLATWVPERDEDGIPILPEEGAPWRYIAGLDLGFNDATALVVAAYSSRLGQLRHVYDVSAPHMLPDDVEQMLALAYRKFGKIEMIYADTSNGKMVIEALKRAGYPIEAAEKRERENHIELVNSAFVRGEIKIIEGTVLHHQLSTTAWDLRKGDFQALARAGRLSADQSIPDDVADAFLYMFRGSLHRFGRKTADPPGPAPGTPEWVKNWEREQLQQARAQFAELDANANRLNRLPKAPAGVQRALRGEWKTPERSPRY